MVNGKDILDFEENNSDKLLEGFCIYKGLPAKNLDDESFVDSIFDTDEYWAYVMEQYGQVE